MTIEHRLAACNSRDDEGMLRRECHRDKQRLSAPPHLTDQRKSAIIFKAFSNRYFGHCERIELPLEALADLVPRPRLRPTQSAALLGGSSA